MRGPVEGQYRLWTDGAARGNPGPAGIGVVLEAPGGEVVERVSRGIGWATNNVAEYEAMIEGLRLARSRGAARLVVHMDSTLVVQQMRGAFKVKSPKLRPRHALARTLAREFDQVRFEAVPRDRNAGADRLANEGIDRWLAENPGAAPPEPAQRELF